MRKLPALRKVVTDRRSSAATTQDDTLWQWYERNRNGIDDRRNGSVVLMNEAHQAVMRWNFENAWINKIEGPGLKASDNEVAIESMELVHEGLTMELEPTPVAG